MMEATSVLPVPNSPVSNTGRFVSAMRSTCFITSMNPWPTRMGNFVSVDVRLPLFITDPFYLLEQCRRGRRPRPGRRPPFHARGLTLLQRARLVQINSEQLINEEETLSISQTVPRQGLNHRR